MYTSCLLLPSVSAFYALPCPPPPFRFSLPLSNPSLTLELSLLPIYFYLLAIDGQVRLVRLIRLVSLQTDNFLLFLLNKRTTTNFRLHEEKWKMDYGKSPGLPFSVRFLLITSEFPNTLINC
jgi:hypothetical protein